MFSLEMETFMYFCMAVYSVVILKIYLDIFFERKEGMYRAVVWSLFFAWQFILNIFLTCLSSGMNLLLTMGTLGIVVWHGYRGDRWKKWIIGLLFLVLWMTLEAVIQYGVMYINVDEKPSMLLLSVLSKVLLCLMVLMIRWWINRYGNGRDGISKEMWMVLLPAGSVVLYYAFHETGQAAGTERVAGLLAVGAALILLIDLSVYPAYVKLMEEAFERKNSYYYIRQMENYQKQTELEEQSITEFRETRHNLKQKLIYMRAMLEQGEHGLLEDALTEVIGDVDYSGRLACETGNRAVDAMVNFKAREMIRQRGRLNAEVKISQNIGITDSDISVLLGNALDNASEALGYVKKKREIWLEMKQEKGLLFIRIKNRYDGRIERDERGHLKSRKNEKGHGIGCFSMERIVKKYHGEMKVEVEDDIFILNIFLYSGYHH